MYINKSFFKIYITAISFIIVLGIYFKYVEYNNFRNMANVKTVTYKKIKDTDIKYLYNEKAKYTILEYNDLNCIHCKNLNKLIENKIDTLKNVSIYKRNVAYINSGESLVKTLYGNCVRNDGGDEAWVKYERQSFDNFERRAEDNIFLSIAKDLVKDKVKFSNCINSDEEKQKVKQGRESAVIDGVNYIPTTYIMLDDEVVKRIDTYTAPGVMSFIEHYNNL